MRKIILLCLVIVCLGACTGPTPLPSTLTPTLRGELRAYSSPTPSQTPTPLPPAASVALTPLPSATPFTHTIAKDDTLLGIAFRYGVSLEALQAANPGVDPGFLVIGQALTIPIDGSSSSAIVQPTPLPLVASAPACYPSADGGLWCFIQVTNTLPVAVENLTGWVSLYDTEGNPLGGEAAVAPLNWLPAELSMPLVAFILPKPEQEFVSQGQVLTAVAVEAGAARYLKADLVIEKVEIAGDGLQAVVQGGVRLPQGSIPGSVWIAAVAYDELGKIVGVRKADLGAPCGTPAPAVPSSTPQASPAAGTPTLTPSPSATAAPLVTCTPFTVTVYSLGPSIQRVEVFVEARP